MNANRNPRGRVGAVLSLLIAAVLVSLTAGPGRAQTPVDDDLEALCAEDMAGRGLGQPGLDQAAVYLESRLRGMELEPAFVWGYRQQFTAPGGEPLVNLVAVVGGADLSRHVIVGAHYDHLGVDAEGQVYPGADDNASGVAAVLELARLLQQDPPAHRVLLVLFAGEESGLLGSRHYVANPALPLEKCTAMLNFDTVGRLEQGGLTIFGADTAQEWTSILQGVDFGFGLDPRLPEKDPGGSDQKSFVEKGVPALQFFTGAHADYHRPSDTLDAIDREGVVVVAAFGAELALYLGELELPLSFLPPGVENAPPPPSGPRRRVSVGTIPDFNHTGEGILITGVIPGSPAEAAGLQAGDLLLELGGSPLDDLAGYSEVLKEHQPGDEVELVFLRDGAEQRVMIVLAERK